MTTELTMLVYATGLLVALVIFQAVAGVRAVGAIPLAGHRDNLPAPTGFHARTLRVVDNHREGITMFAPLVLIAAAANIHNGMTVLGAELFFWSRLVHAILYIAGAPMIRPLAWAVGMAGIVIVLLAVLGIIS